ncbi:MAG: hypothetical protein ABR592_05340 [Nitriliruptorales bacterium]
MDASDVVMQKAVSLASSGLNLQTARDALLADTDCDRLALEVARAVILRDGLPRCRPASPTRGRPPGSLRNRTLNLIEYALEGASHENDGESSKRVQAPYSWSEVLFDTWD